MPEQSPILRVLIRLVPEFVLGDALVNQWWCSLQWWCLHGVIPGVVTVAFTSTIASSSVYLLKRGTVLCLLNRLLW